MQLDVPQNVRMVETAMSLETVTAPLGGQEIGVKKVNHCTRIVKLQWYEFWSLPLHISFLAQCRPSCANGGHCVIPGHCACPSNWTGSRCEEGILAITSLMILSMKRRQVNIVNWIISFLCSCVQSTMCKWWYMYWCWRMCLPSSLGGRSMWTRWVALIPIANFFKLLKSIFWAMQINISCLYSILCQWWNLH